MADKSDPLFDRNYAVKRTSVSHVMGGSVNHFSPLHIWRPIWIIAPLVAALFFKTEREKLAFPPGNDNATQLNLTVAKIAGPFPGLSISMQVNDDDFLYLNENYGSYLVGRAQQSIRNVNLPNGCVVLAPDGHEWLLFCGSSQLLRGKF